MSLFFSSKSNFKYDWHMSRGEMAKMLHAICYGYVTRLEGTKNVSCLNLMAGTSYGKKSGWQMSRHGKKKRYSQFATSM